jgi:hypothetical protein
MRSRHTTRVLAGLAATALLGAGGCYQHVVGVKGPASQNYDVHEPNIGRGESVWSPDQPRPVEQDRYSQTTLDRAKPVPSKTRKSGD